MSTSIPKSSGIYKVVCMLNGRFYVGSTHNFYERWINHKKLLRKNKHHSVYMQRAWNKYGETAFSFEIIELVDLEQLLIREQFWLDTLSPFGNKGFNTSRMASGTSVKDRKLTDEHKAKISASHIGIKPSEETKRKQSVAKLGKPHKPHSEATKEKMRQSAKLRSTPEYRQRISGTLKNHPRYKKEE